jgi:hypothetical protein
MNQTSAVRENQICVLRRITYDLINIFIRKGFVSLRLAFVVCLASEILRALWRMCCIRHLLCVSHAVKNMADDTWKHCASWRHRADELGSGSRNEAGIGAVSFCGDLVEATQLRHVSVLLFLLHARIISVNYLSTSSQNLRQRRQKLDLGCLYKPLTVPFLFISIAGLMTISV